MKTTTKEVKILVVEMNEIDENINLISECIKGILIKNYIDGLYRELRINLGCATFLVIDYYSIKYNTYTICYPDGEDNEFKYEDLDIPTKKLIDKILNTK